MIDDDDDDDDVDEYHDWYSTYGWDEDYEDDDVSESSLDDNVVPKYDIGDVVRLSVFFTNMVGEAIDPTVATCLITNPSGVVTTCTYGVRVDGLMRSSIGRFFLDYPLLVEGVYTYRFAGTGVCQTTEEKSFSVRYKGVTSMTDAELSASVHVDGVTYAEATVKMATASDNERSGG